MNEFTSFIKFWSFLALPWIKCEIYLSLTILLQSYLKTFLSTEYDNDIPIPQTCKHNSVFPSLFFFVFGDFAFYEEGKDAVWFYCRELRAGWGDRLMREKNLRKRRWSGGDSGLQRVLQKPAPVSHHAISLNRLWERAVNLRNPIFDSHQKSIHPKSDQSPF